MARFESKEEDIGAQDYRAYFDSSVLRVWHLNGKERTFRIASVTRLTAEFKGESRKQPLLRLEDGKGQPVPLPLCLNKTNAKTIAALYGNNPLKWTGKLITLYPTTTDVAGRTEDCIRIRNTVPKAPAKRAQQQEQAPTANGHDDGPEYRDVTTDPDEPPPGALETDNVQ